MLIQWHLDVPYGEQSEAAAAVRARGGEKFASSYRALGSRPG